MPPRPQPPTNADFNPGGAHVCTDHFNRLECTKNRRHNRGRCHSLAIRGTNACRRHQGIKKNLAKLQGQARIQAKIDAFNAEGSNEGAVDASTAVLGVLQMSWLRLGTYSRMLRDQIDKARIEQDDPIKGIVGFRYGMGGKEGIQYVQTEEIRALVLLEAQERDRVVKYAKVAHDMGISTRLTALAERWGEVVSVRIAEVLEQLDLTAEQSLRVPELVQMHLGSIDIEQIEHHP